MELIKKINMRILIILLLATQAQAQVDVCDSITYWTDQGQGFNIGLDTSGITQTPDSIDVWWAVCTNGLCYSGNGMNYYFPQITTADTLKVGYDIYLYISNTMITCTVEDWLIYNGSSWVLFNNGTVGIIEHKDKIVNNKMYDLYGREILKPKGLYIQNNKLNYEQ